MTHLERGGEEAEPHPKGTFIEVILNRASLGEAEYTYVLIRGDNGHLLDAYVPRKDIVVNEQKLNPSGEFSGHLMVDVVGTEDDYDLVALQTDRGSSQKVRVNRATHRVVFRQVVTYRL